MAPPTPKTLGASKSKRTVKPKDIFMVYEGDVDPTTILFTKDALAVLEACQGTAKKYAKIVLPAPKSRAPKAA